LLRENDYEFLGGALEVTFVFYGKAYVARLFGTDGAYFDMNYVARHDEIGGAVVQTPLASTLARFRSGTALARLWVHGAPPKRTF
jgi:hypothetical protein